MMEQMAQEYGTVRVSSDVIAQLVEKAAECANGITLAKSPLSRTLWNVFCGKGKSNGMKIRVDGNGDVAINVCILVRPDRNITELSKEFQKQIKSQIEKVLDVKIKMINIEVQGIERGSL